MIRKFLLFIFLPIFLISCSKSFDDKEAKVGIQRSLPHFVEIESLSLGAQVPVEINGDSCFEMLFTAKIKLKENTFAEDGEAIDAETKSKVLFVKPVLTKGKSFEVSGKVRKYFRKSGELVHASLDSFDVVYLGKTLYDLSGKGAIIVRGSKEEETFKDSLIGPFVKFKEMLADSVWTVSTFDKEFNKAKAYFYRNGDVVLDWYMPVRYAIGKWSIKDDETLVINITSNENGAIKWRSEYKLDTKKSKNPKRPNFTCVSSTGGKKINLSLAFDKPIKHAKYMRNVYIFGDWAWSNKVLEIPTTLLKKSKLGKRKDLSIVSSYNVDGTFEHNYFYLKENNVYFVNRITGTYIYFGTGIIRETILTIGGKPVKKKPTYTFRFSSKVIDHNIVLFSDGKFKDYEQMNSAIRLVDASLRETPKDFNLFESHLLGKKTDSFLEALQGLVFSDNIVMAKDFAKLSKLAMKAFKDYEEFFALDFEKRKDFAKKMKETSIPTYEKALIETRKTLFEKANGMPQYEFSAYISVLRAYESELILLKHFLENPPKDLPKVKGFTE